MANRSIKPVAQTIDEFHSLMVDGTYAPEVQMAQMNYITGNKSEARRFESMLPVFYPGIDPESIREDNTIDFNGIVVATLQAYSPEALIDAKRHLKSWKFVKMIYNNVRGKVYVLFWMGPDVKTIYDFKTARERLEQLLMKALPNVHFFIRRRPYRGIMMSYDPQAFIRPDAELEPPTLGK